MRSSLLELCYGKLITLKRKPVLVFLIQYNRVSDDWTLAAVLQGFLTR